MGRDQKRIARQTRHCAAGSQILWGHVFAVSTTALVFLWSATEWTAFRLAFQPELGRPWFTLGRWPIYEPQSFLWWWIGYDAYAHDIFVQGGYIAAAGGLASAASASLPMALRAGPMPGRLSVPGCLGTRV